MSPDDQPDYAEEMERRAHAAVANIVRRAKGEQATQDVTELAEALGVPTDTAWSTLLVLAEGAVSIANRVVNAALPAYDETARQELLANLGIAEEYARVRVETDREAERAGFLEQLRVDDEKGAMVAELELSDFEGQPVMRLMDDAGISWFTVTDLRVLIYGAPNQGTEPSRMARWVEEVNPNWTRQASRTELHMLNQHVKGRSRASVTAQFVTRQGAFLILNRVRGKSELARRWQEWVNGDALPAMDDARLLGASKEVIAERLEPTTDVAVPQSTGHMLKLMVEGFIELERREEENRRAIEAMSDDMIQIKDQVSRHDAIAAPDGWVTAQAWAVRRGISRNDRYTMNQLGHIVGKLARADGLEAQKIPHERDGWHNGWPLSYWDKGWSVLCDEKGWTRP